MGAGQCFIVATNELDERALSDPEVLRAYKGQSSKVERGFRFLKDPMFVASTLYLKRVERVMALLMVMRRCVCWFMRRWSTASARPSPNTIELAALEAGAIIAPPQKM